MLQPGLACLNHPSSRVRGLLLGLALAGVTLSSGIATAADAPPPPDLQKTELYSANYDVTWDKLLATLKSFDLSVATADKDGGKVTTAPNRYFKISSAKFPPVQDDYRDTYEIKVDKRADNKTTQVQITRKFEMYDRAMPPMGGWAVQQDVKEKTGTSIDEILSALALEIAAASLSGKH